MTQQPEQTTQQRTIAGRYVVLREIGRGGMGIVWLAEDRTIGRQVAIKELHLPAGVPPHERAVLEERVLREARTAGRLNDPAVVTVYDVLQEAGNTYIVMELIQAPTLSAIVSRQGPLGQDAVARLAEQLLSALEAAHAAGIVHRDVKPSNIMVLPNGRVKLTDFGIAQSTDDPKLTTSGILVGSPSYIAPERLRGADADAGSDRWALASVLFYAVEGHSPFERSTTAATMHAILNEVPFLTRCQGPLASAIMGLLNTVPTARLSAAQVRGLLAQATNTPPSGTQTVFTGPGHGGGTALYPGPGQNPAGPRRRRPGPVVAVAVLLLVVGFVGGWLTGNALETDPNADDARLQTLTYGPDGQVKEFALSNNNCSNATLQAGRSYPSSSGDAACDDAHQFEVLSAFDTGGTDHVAFPGDARMEKLGEAACGFLFDAAPLANGVDRNTLSYQTLVPTKREWDAAEGDSGDGDRSVYCVLEKRDGSQLAKSPIKSD